MVEENSPTTSVVYIIGRNVIFKIFSISIYRHECMLASGRINAESFKLKPPTVRKTRK